MYDYIKFKLIYMRDNTDRLQIGHSHDKEMEFKITCRVSDDRQVEVPFPIVTSFMQSIGYMKEVESMSSTSKNMKSNPTGFSL